MNDLYTELLNLCYENGYSSEEIDIIKKAYEYAKGQHEGKKRKNGEDYITHPLNVAMIVANLNTDATTVISALLHECIAHGSSTYDDIEENFGKEVRNVVESLDKINRLHLLDSSESSALYLRKVLVALSEDVRVIILKLAGRLHNMRTIDGLPKEQQHQKALETWNVLIPIAHRLGINQVKAELEDLSFKILHEDDYHQIEEQLPETREVLNSYLQDMKEDISELLRENNISFEIKGRVKSVSSLYNKLSNGKKWNEIYDVLGLRVICEEETECYLIIGLIHSMYRPIPKRFKDYIAMPKGNSYQSLHTGIYGPHGLPVEVQVRTKEMNEIAEHGVASHWSYKEKNSKHIQTIMEQKLQMFRSLIESNADEVTDDETFASTMNTELFSTSIYVYTPNGDVVELPVKATPLDFAYRIHSRVGDTTVGAIVNENIVPLDYELQDGDIVKILTNSSSTPNKDWLNIVKTTQAKAKIKSYFSKQDREEYIAKGRELLEKELKRQHINLSDAMSQERLDKLQRDLKVNNFDEVLLQIGSARFTPVYIVSLLYEEKKNVQDLLLDKVMNNSLINKTNYKNDIIVSGCDDLLVNLAACCKPVYGDDIIGYITKGQGITVHKKDCVNVRDLKERLIDVEWNPNKSDDKQYYAKLKIYTNGTKSNLLDIISKSTIRGVTVTSINELTINGNIHYDLLIRVKDKTSLGLFIDDVKTLPFVADIKRY